MSGLLVNVLTGPGTDVWIVPTKPGGAPQPLLADAFLERDARISHDGRWVAYVSDESGRPEVSVRSIIGPPPRIVISSEGGDQPVWRRDGSELFFIDPQGQFAERAGPLEPRGAPDLRTGDEAQRSTNRSRPLGNAV
jgi:hypothetical protein